MRKIILMVSLLLISGAAEAGQMRGLTLASNAPATEQTRQSQPSASPLQAQPPVKAEAGAAAKEAAVCDDRDEVRHDDRDRDDIRRDDRHDRRPVRHHESAEHKARRIAAHYGIYW